MFIDSSEFPLVWMRQNGKHHESREAPFKEFESLLAREQAFVILNDSGVDESEHEHTQEERKQTSLWMKRNKAALRQFVKAMVVIEKNPAKRIAAKAFSVMFGKFWGYPMLIVADTEQAQELAQKLLRGEQADTQAL